MRSRLRALALVPVAAIVSPQRQIQAAVLASSATGTPPTVLTIEGLGKGVAPLDGPWQFHLGEDPTWAPRNQRTLAKFAPQPVQMLAKINQRLDGRLQGGFATCIAVLLNPDGSCILASAGHPAPF